MDKEQVHMGLTIWDNVIAAENSCEWLKDWLTEGKTLCVPHLTGNLFISGCDAEYEVPIKYCPGCGRKIELIRE